MVESTMMLRLVWSRHKDTYGIDFFRYVVYGWLDVSPRLLRGEGPETDGPALLVHGRGRDQDRDCMCDGPFVSASLVKRSPQTLYRPNPKLANFPSVGNSTFLVTSSSR